VVVILQREGGMRLVEGDKCTWVLSWGLERALRGVAGCRSRKRGKKSGSRLGNQKFVSLGIHRNTKM
jgi:hypothetical protein